MTYPIKIFHGFLDHQKIKQINDLDIVLSRAKVYNNLGDDHFTSTSLKRRAHTAMISEIPAETLEPLNQIIYDYHEQTGIQITMGDSHFQISEYRDRNAGNFDNHNDIIWTTDTHRKLTAIVMLEQCESGGDLKVMNTHIDLKIGDAVIFPSTYEHSVSPVKSGTRRSLTVWCMGPAWI